MNNQNQGFVYFGPQVPANVKATLMLAAQPDSGEMKNFYCPSCGLEFSAYEFIKCPQCECDVRAEHKRLKKIIDELMSSETLFCPVCRYKSKNDELLDSNEWSTFCLRCRFNITEFIEKVKETCADNCKNELKNTDYCFTCNTSPLVKLIKEMNPALVSAVYIAPQYMGEYYKNQKSADMPKIADWTCSCSNTNKAAYKFCTECGKQKPVE